jgi:hypothetical protein
MIKVIQKILVFLIAAGIAVFMLFASFWFGVLSTQWQDSVWESGTWGRILFYKSTLLLWTGASSSSLKYVSRSDDPSELKKNETFYIDFGRLSSIFFLPGSLSGSESLKKFHLEKNILTIPSSWSMIASLYDPFVSYSLYSPSGEFTLDQVTNGSFYVWNESDGTISLYSIDAVGTLTFLSKWQKMTTMTLFPWMYFRFDPSENKNFAWADLFQIIQSVSTQKEGIITGMEFVNPRIDTGNALDAFFMYRLPPQTRVLFRQLRTLFVQRVDQVNMMRSYSASGDFLALEDMNSLLINPGKRNAILLMDLQSTFSDSLQARVDTDKFVRRIQNIHDTAEKLPIGNDVDKLFQEFLTDGRFAMFSQVTDQKFVSIYNEVAKIIGIAPNTQKYQLFQKLSDIYSRNLVNQLQGSVGKNDVYTSSANELIGTLSASWMTGDDYFNIALYALNILSKSQEQNLFTVDFVKSNATYNFIYTIFVATDNYLSSITDSNKKSNTQNTIAHQLYVPLSESLVLSLYKYFTIDQNWYIYLSPIFFPDGPNEKMKFDSNFVASVNKIYGIMNRAVDIWSFPGSSKEDYSRLNTASMRMRAFVSLFNNTEYPEYIKDPFISQDAWGISIPKLTDDTVALVHKNDAMKATTSLSGNNLPTPDISWDNPLLRIQKLFGNIPQEQITREVDWFRVSGASMRLESKNAQPPIFFTISFKASLDLVTISEVQIEYEGHNITFSRNQYLTNDFLAFLSSNASLYFQKISASLLENPWVTGDIIFFIWDNRITIWGYSFNL